MWRATELTAVAMKLILTVILCVGRAYIQICDAMMVIDFDSTKKAVRSDVPASKKLSTIHVVTLKNELHLMSSQVK